MRCKHGPSPPHLCDIPFSFKDLIIWNFRLDILTLIFLFFFLSIYYKMTSLHLVLIKLNFLNLNLNYAIYTWINMTVNQAWNLHVYSPLNQAPKIYKNKTKPPKSICFIWNSEEYLYYYTQHRCSIHLWIYRGKCSARSQRLILNKGLLGI